MGKNPDAGGADCFREIRDQDQGFAEQSAFRGGKTPARKALTVIWDKEKGEKKVSAQTMSPLISSALAAGSGISAPA